MAGDREEVEAASAVDEDDDASESMAERGGPVETGKRQCDSFAISSQQPGPVPRAPSSQPQPRRDAPSTGRRAGGQPIPPPPRHPPLAAMRRSLPAAHSPSAFSFGHALPHRGYGHRLGLADLLATSTVLEDAAVPPVSTARAGYVTPRTGYVTPRAAGYVTPGATGYVTPGTGYVTPGTGYVTPGAGYVTPGATGYVTPGATGYVTPGAVRPPGYQAQQHPDLPPGPRAVAAALRAHPAAPPPTNPHPPPETHRPHTPAATTATTTATAAAPPTHWRPLRTHAPAKPAPNAGSRALVGENGGGVSTATGGGGDHRVPSAWSESPEEEARERCAEMVAEAEQALIESVVPS
ncbi:hypothetical protein PAPYR_1437 [Paratrimastix pyriformis]|uniref:Uncharacterized protein n=1 Tax=Paratrimastix pyriformis TaxID=342808 RepID=A0ABQ8UVU9_9EUKA|nr:hypothetical protein PAPYR_1437 [Paratrimastix pyriformis]